MIIHFKDGHQGLFLSTFTFKEKTMGQKNEDRPTADQVLQKLLEGNKRFTEGNLLHPNHCEESRQLVMNKQEPVATILTCADSRVPPVDIFDQGIGDLFIVRVAGNIIGDHTLGTIEYGVSQLHTPLVIVMGHSSCGAITAVASGATLGGHMATLAPPIQTAIKSIKDAEGDLIENASKEVACQIARSIETSEPIIADYVKEGAVKVIAAYYDLKSGTVSVLPK
jgi:carbonic anhydrase